MFNPAFLLIRSTGPLCAAMVLYGRLPSAYATFGGSGETGYFR